MKVLLLGEYSNLHWTLAQGLRALGVCVTVASAGDHYKNYVRDIDIRREGYSLRHSVKYIYRMAQYFRTFRGYDVVQVINPFFLDLRAEKNLYAFQYLKRHNGKVFMGAFGDDCYWLQACLNRQKFRYSEFDVPGREGYMPSAQSLIKTWSDPDKVRVNRKIADLSDGIIACLYEYYVSYIDSFSEKLKYIPAPIDTNDLKFRERGRDVMRVNFFIGIQNQRSEIKGTDILYNALKKIEQQYPRYCSVQRAESVEYAHYLKLMEQSDVLLDQLYSYSPGMNGLSALAQGLVTVGGGEPEIYELLKENINRPIVNVLPLEEDVFSKLENLILVPEQIRERSVAGRKFIEEHHDFIKIARQYYDFWIRSL